MSKPRVLLTMDDYDALRAERDTAMTERDQTRTDCHALVELAQQYRTVIDVLLRERSPLSARAVRKADA